MNNTDLVRLHSEYARLGTDVEDSMKLGLFLHEFLGLSDNAIDIKVPDTYRVPIDVKQQYLSADFMSDMYLMSVHQFSSYTNNQIFYNSLRLVLDRPTLNLPRRMGRATELK